MESPPKKGGIFSVAWEIGALPKRQGKFIEDKNSINNKWFSTKWRVPFLHADVRIHNVFEGMTS